MSNIVNISGSLPSNPPIPEGKQEKKRKAPDSIGDALKVLKNFNQQKIKEQNKKEKKIVTISSKRIATQKTPPQKLAPKPNINLLINDQNQGPDPKEIISSFNFNSMETALQKRKATKAKSKHSFVQSINTETGVTYVHFQEINSPFLTYVNLCKLHQKWNNLSDKTKKYFEDLSNIECIKMNTGSQFKYLLVKWDHLEELEKTVLSEVVEEKLQSFKIEEYRLAKNIQNFITKLHRTAAEIGKEVESNISPNQTQMESGETSKS